jgi:hypothetical protein
MTALRKTEAGKGLHPSRLQNKVGVVQTHHRVEILVGISSRCNKSVGLAGGCLSEKPANPGSVRAHSQPGPVALGPKGTAEYLYLPTRQAAAQDGPPGKRGAPCPQKNLPEAA